MWHDNETRTDLLGFEALADACVEVLETENLLPVTVGLFGDWGSGKSSLMGMVEDRLAERNGVVCLRFNGWSYEGYDDLRAALMEEMYQCLRENLTRGAKAERLLVRLRKRIDWFRAAGLAARGVVALTAGAGVEGGALPSYSELKSLWKSDVEDEETPQETIRGFRSDFEELVGKTRISTLVVFIDDLDRCLPPQIIDTLEAIRLFLSIPRTAFVIAAAEEVIQKAVETRYPEFTTKREWIGQQYLEKLVQIPFRIPKLSPAETEVYLNLLFAELALKPEDYQKLVHECQSARGEKRYAVSLNIGVARDVLGEAAGQLDEAFGLTQRIAPVMCAGLKGNPRQIKRFLNTLQIRLRMGERLGMTFEMGVLAKLMILEYFHHGAFKEAFYWQQRTEGPPPEMRALEEADGDNPVEGVSESWRKDPGLVKWKNREPKLTDVDLRPYFYVTRESLAERVSAVQRLTREDQELVENLSSQSDTFRKKAVAQLVKVPLEQAQGVIEAAGERLRTLDDKSDLIDALLECAIQRAEAAPRVLEQLKACSTAGLGTSVPVKLQRLAVTHAEHREAVIELLHSWSVSAESGLKKSVGRALSKLGGDS